MFNLDNLTVDFTTTPQNKLLILYLYIFQLLSWMKVVAIKATGKAQLAVSPTTP